MCAYLLKATIWLYNWIKSIPIWVWWTTLGISVVVVVCGVVLEVTKNMKERTRGFNRYNDSTR